MSIIHDILAVEPDVVVAHEEAIELFEEALESVDDATRERFRAIDLVEREFYTFPQRDPAYICVVGPDVKPYVSDEGERYYLIAHPTDNRRAIVLRESMLDRHYLDRLDQGMVTGGVVVGDPHEEEEGDETSDAADTEND